MKYLKWKGASDAGHFVYYDKEKEENVVFDLKEFTVTEVKYKVIGWSNDGAQIFSNEIAKWDEELSVASKKDGNISGLKNKDGDDLKGVWKEIKEDVKAAGGKINILAYALSGGEKIQLELDGTKFFKLSEALNSIDRATTAIKFDGYTDEKNGAVKYRSPIFVAGGPAEKGAGAEDISVEDIPF